MRPAATRKLIGTVLEPQLPQLIGGGGNGVRILHLELDAHLRHGPVGRPIVGAEARLRRLGERPDAEMLAAPNPLAVEVLTAGVGLERKPQRVDVQLAALRRVGRDHGDARDPFDVHGRQLTANTRAAPVLGWPRGSKQEVARR